MDRQQIRRILLKCSCLTPLLAGLLLYSLLPFFPSVAEVAFARGLFRVLSMPMGVLVGVLPFSLTELLAVAFLPVLAGLIAVFIFKRRRSPAPKKKAGRWLQRVGWVLSIGFLAYMLLHGAQFYRRPVGDLMDLPAADGRVTALYQAAVSYAKEAARLREGLPEDSDGCMTAATSAGELLSKAGEGYGVLEQRYPFLQGWVQRAKPVRLSHYWSYTGISGMYFPFLVEANVNVDMPDSAIPMTAAHELAHTRGFAREDECNFLGCLACFEHPDPTYQYSGYLEAFLLCARALYQADQGLWEEAYDACSDGMHRDLRQRSDYWAAFEGAVETASAAVNDGFIRAQGVPDGVESYDRAVELLLRYHQQNADSI